MWQNTCSSAGEGQVVPTSLEKEPWLFSTLSSSVDTLGPTAWSKGTEKSFVDNQPGRVT